MGILEIISGVLLLLSCVIIILVVMFQESKSNLSGAVTGGASDSFYSKNRGRTLSGLMQKFTKVAAIILFVLTIAVNAINIWM